MRPGIVLGFFAVALIVVIEGFYQQDFDSDESLKIPVQVIYDDPSMARKSPDTDEIESNEIIPGLLPTRKSLFAKSTTKPTTTTLISKEPRMCFTDSEYEEFVTRTQSTFDLTKNCYNDVNTLCFHMCGNQSSCIDDKANCELYKSDSEKLKKPSTVAEIYDGKRCMLQREYDLIDEIKIVSSSFKCVELLFDLKKLCENYCNKEQDCIQKMCYI